ncbi:MAG: Lrp/AsnC family transcriptional regulator [Caldilinea sp.]|uniref:Lrp/AsnC family transcriptional regulator n=1 Tax=Caldilinea sp. TaxID=2293560 RepID=UPI002BCDC21B|nr:Lrp/AsnC family transcriptional regulator [Anaerolineales bacterium]HQY90934.1 Lrp/AsnC family transcriptional regulator [Caldilinea sp.]HRA64542.1 Lrp/AsnC family transcriptional regulator [Caldilinea sp.]
MNLDELDRRILIELQCEARIANAELARRLNLSPPAVHARLKRLEEEGLVRGYVALLDRERLGFDMLCFIQITLQLHQIEQVTDFRVTVQQIPEVLECHHVTGEYDYLLKIVVRNRQELERLVMEKLTPIPGVARIHTSLVFSEIKTSTALPLAGSV